MMVYVICMENDYWDSSEIVPIGVFTTREKLEEYLGNIQFMVYGNVESATPKEYFDAIADGKEVTPMLRFYLSRKIAQRYHNNVIDPTTSVASYKKDKNLPDRYYMREERFGLYVEDSDTLYVREMPLDCIVKDLVDND